MEVQLRISSILTSIDDKIELNLKTNSTLKEITKALFQEMCVSKSEALHEGWKMTNLEEFVEIKNGYAFKGMDFIEDGVPVIKIKKRESR